MTTLMVNIFLVAMLMVIAVLALRTRRLFAAIILAAAYSLISAAVFVNLDAVDVAFTEAAVGAGVSTVLLLAALSRLPKEERRSKPMRFNFPLMVCVATGAMLIFAVLDLPDTGDPFSAVHSHVAPRYLVESEQVLHIPNVVTTVLASYRGFDTLGEVIVIFAAGLGVVLLLGGRAAGWPATLLSKEQSKKPRNQKTKSGRRL